MMDIDALLTNWGRWARMRMRQGHCASIEWRYRMRWRPDNAPTGWGDWSGVPAAPPLPPLDAIAALAVERVMRDVPSEHREALALHYVYRTDARFACRALAVRYADWERFLDDARSMCANRLRRQDKRRIVRENSSPPVATEILAPIGAG